MTVFGTTEPKIFKLKMCLVGVWASHCVCVCALHFPFEQKKKKKKKTRIFLQRDEFKLQTKRCKLNCVCHCWQYYWTKCCFSRKFHPLRKHFNSTTNIFHCVLDFSYSRADDDKSFIVGIILFHMRSISIHLLYSCQRRHCCQIFFANESKNKIKKKVKKKTQQQQHHTIEPKKNKTFVQHTL